MERKITCESVWDLLSAYADGESTPAEAALVEHHTSCCADCARDLRFMRETASVLSREPEIAPPPGLHEAILAATVYRQTWQQRVAAQIRAAFSSPAAAGLGLAGAAAAAAVVMLIGPHSPTLPPGMVRAAAPGGRVALRPSERRVARVASAARPSPAAATSTKQNRPSGSRTMVAVLPRPAPVISKPSLLPIPAPDLRPARRSVKPAPVVGIAGPRRRIPDSSPAPAGSSLAPPPPVDPSLPPTGTTERTAIAASPPMPATGNEEKTVPVKTPPVEVRLQLAANDTVNASGYASLAGLRAKIHHDNQRAMSAVYELAPEEHRVVTVDLYKSHF